MTFEEAKEVFLNRGYVEVDGGTIYDKWRESCRVISEWLEQQPCKDAVSRQAVLNEIKSMPNLNPLWSILIDRENLIDNIKDLPPVTPTRKKGKWRFDEENTYHCSLCGRTVRKDWVEDMQIDYPYCHCGAEMEGEE